jgi:hypothetical protein
MDSKTEGIFATVTGIIAAVIVVLLFALPALNLLFL